jgi:RNA polymerase sigma factor (sigma-70 family)
MYTIMLSKGAKEKYRYYSEEDIWTDFKKGDKQAYEFIFKKYYNLLLCYGMKINRNTEETKDCIQQLFAGLWESRQRLGSNDSIRSYLSASLRRIILRRLKVKFQYVNIEDINPGFRVEISPELKFIKNQREVEQVKLVSDLIQNLPDRQKEALYLRYYSDYSFGEIAETMGITTRGVYKLLYKAFDHLTIQVEQKKLSTVILG